MTLDLNICDEEKLKKEMKKYYFKLEKDSDGDIGVNCYYNKEKQPVRLITFRTTGVFFRSISCTSEMNALSGFEFNDDGEIMSDDE